LYNKEERYKKRIPEILAPAGSVESMYAAINAGCDAVYIGGGQFGARAYADNPGSSELIDAIRYCHIHNVKLYMTVNTLLKDNEITSSLYNYIKPYYEAGLDAAIVQDTGVMYMLHKWFPELPLHASTQMTLVMGESTDILERHGITRIVPARELCLGELKRMRNSTDAEIEVFVHGALCYCYSGQCLFSSMLGGRSGNRGRCAQPCRLPYHAGAEGGIKENYILSMKELCLLPYIGELIEAGADSFKIEGRMKRPAYTALVTAMYRKYTDLYMELGRDGYNKYIKNNQEEMEHDIEMLAEVYNREGFTQGYLEGSSRGSKKDMLASVRPNHGGTCIGEVQKTGKGILEYKLFKDINAQDVIEFRDRHMKPVYEYTSGKSIRAGSIVEAKFKKGCIIHVKDKAYRTKNSALLDNIKDMYINTDKKAVINGRFEALPGEKAVFSINKDGCEAVVYGSICQPAEKSAASEESVRKSLSQTGGTEFEFGNLEIIIGKGLFLQAGMVKNMRRQAISMLKENIALKYARKADKKLYKTSQHETYKEYSHDIIYKASVMTMGQLEAVLKEEKISVVYIKTELLDNKTIIKALGIAKTAGKQCYIVLPRIFRQETWDYEEKCITEGKSIYTQEWDGYVIQSFEEYVFLKNIVCTDPGKIITDTSLYIMNRPARSFWKELGVTRYTFPFELALGETGQVTTGVCMEAVIYAHIPLMVSAQCMVNNVKSCNGFQYNKIYDTKGRGFITANYCKYCYNTIYQDIPLYAKDYIYDFCNLGIYSFRYDFTIEKADTVSKVLKGEYNGETGTGHYFNLIK